MDEPFEASVVSSTMQVSGWVYSIFEPISRVEVFLSGIPLGTLRYGDERPDVASYPSKAPLRCGYHGQLVIDESFRGKQVLTVRVTDRRGEKKDFRRSINVDHSEMQPTFTGCVAIAEAGQLSAPAISQLLRDDLSAGKSLMSTTGRISLESFLIAGSSLQFSQVESPQISIILVLFNRAELTLQCLHSILRCNFQSYEVVIVDNGSSDETGRLLNQIEGARIIRNNTNYHYLLACNQASREARGECLLLLNNDTQLLGNSLEFAIKTLRSSDDIGAVGGRIVLPDGTLQEAGSIIWQDGSCIGYGRGDSPFAPAYMFKRDVDYCSAAFLLTWRNLFLEGGGFDVAYVPAYYEETDYCVSLSWLGFSEKQPNHRRSS